MYIYIRIYKSNVCSVKCPVTSCFAWALYYLWFDILDILGMITVMKLGVSFLSNQYEGTSEGFEHCSFDGGMTYPTISIAYNCQSGYIIHHHLVGTWHTVSHQWTYHTRRYIYIYWWYKLHWDDHQFGSLQRRAWWWLHTIYWWCYIVILFYYTCTYCLYYMTYQ